MDPAFELHATAAASRLFLMTELEVAGGGLGFQVLIPLVELDVVAAGSRDRRSGVGDLTVGAVAGWRRERLYFAAGVDIVLPTGHYSTARLANLGLNYASIRPLGALTYLNPEGFDATIKLTYTFNTENEATKYRSGELIHADWNVGYRLARGVKIGVAGYILEQVTDDRLQGQRAGANGNRSSAYAIGPSMLVERESYRIEGKFLTDIEARNRPSGQSIWIKTSWSW